MSELFKIVKIDGKGLGAIAVKDIPARGTLILREKPQLIIQRESYKMTFLQLASYNTGIIKCFGQMSENNQKEFLDLFNERQEFDDRNLKILDIFNKNKFRNAFREPNTEIVCLKTSRFNHSCRSNAYWDIDWDKKDLEMEIKALEFIKAGQEITISYTSTYSRKDLTPSFFIR